jgi:hypothetical protein
MLMIKFFLSVFCFCFTFLIQSQELITTKDQIRTVMAGDSSRLGTENTKTDQSQIAKISDYLIFDKYGNTGNVDTTLSIQKAYKFNYLREDSFNLMPFANMGQTYNTLSFEFNQYNTLPLFGARARHFNYFEIDDMRYYKVPTPVSELFYKTGMQQGQVLDAFVTLNTSERFNFSLAYKGTRSNGFYNRHLTSTGNFRFTANYTNRNDRYRALAHITMQDLLNQESGGLRDQDVDNFISGEDDFLDRGIFTPNLNNAENLLEGKRFFINHSYDLFNSKDSTSNKLSLVNETYIENKKYRFSQPNAITNFFGPSFSNVINDEVKLSHFHTAFWLEANNGLLGKFTAGINYDNYNYGYNRLTILDEGTVRNRLLGSILGIRGSYEKSIDKFKLTAVGNLNLSGDFNGYHLNGNLGYNYNNDISANAYLTLNSALPNYNALLFQSSYVNYNWDNADEFSNIDRQHLGFEVKSKKYGSIMTEFGNLLNYTYFSNTATAEETTVIRALQSNEAVNYFKIQLDKEFKYKNFYLDNRLLYQNVTDGKDVFNVPDLVLRSTLYYSNYLFKKAMLLQTGVTLNYFTSYYMNAYDPLLAEFYVQNDTKFGNFPRLDFFVNAKVRQTRIYLKAEHFNSSFTGYNYFAAPNYPYRDFIIRFGIVWNFFL